MVWKMLRLAGEYFKEDIKKEEFLFIHRFNGLIDVVTPDI